MEYYKIVEQLDKIANSFSVYSDEHEAIEAALFVVHEFSHINAVKQFSDIIKNQKEPLTGYQLLQLKIYEIEIPKTKRTPELILLEKEIDLLAEKLKRHCIKEV